MAADGGARHASDCASSVAGFCTSGGERRLAVPESGGESCSAIVRSWVKVGLLTVRRCPTHGGVPSARRARSRRWRSHARKPCCRWGFGSPSSSAVAGLPTTEPTPDGLNGSDSTSCSPSGGPPLPGPIRLGPPRLEQLRPEAADLPRRASPARWPGAIRTPSSTSRWPADLRLAGGSDQAPACPRRATSGRPKGSWLLSNAALPIRKDTGLAHRAGAARRGSRRVEGRPRSATATVSASSASRSSKRRASRCCGGEYLFAGNRTYGLRSSPA